MNTSTTTIKKIGIFCLALFILIGIGMLFIPFSSENAQAASFDVTLAPLSFVYDGNERELSANGFSENEDFVFSWRKKMSDGSFATVSSEPTLKIKDVSDSGKYDVVITDAEGARHRSSPVDVTVNPYPITVEIRNVWSFYGTELVPLEYDIITELPASGEKAEIILEKAPGNEAGSYKITGACTNDNYIATFNSAEYVIARAPIYVYFSAKNNDTEVYRGENITYDYTYESSVPSTEDELAIKIRYLKYNENSNQFDIKRDKIDEPGYYLVSPYSENPNYFIPDFYSVTINVIPSESTDKTSGIKIGLENGFSAATAVKVTENKDVDSLVSKYSNMFDTQIIYKAFSVDLKGETDSKMLVSVPVDNENKHYTVAIEKADGTVTYRDCVVGDGYATFEVSAEDTNFILWRDKDNTAYLVLCFVLLLFIIAEICVLVPLVKNNRNAKNCAFALLPLSQGGFLSCLSIYACIGICVVEGVIALILLIAILAVRTSLKKRINKL